MDPWVRSCRAWRHPRLAWQVLHSLRVAGLQKAGAGFVCNEAVCTVHSMSAMLPSQPPLCLGDGRLALFSPYSQMASAWHTGLNSLGLWVFTDAPARKVPRLLQDVLCSAPSCPPDHSCRQPEPHSSCLSHSSRPQAAVPPAWPREKPLPISSCCPFTL